MWGDQHGVRPRSDSARLAMVMAFAVACVVGLLVGCSTGPANGTSNTPDAAPAGSRASSPERAASGQPRGWQPYANLGGDSGVVAYEIGGDFIRVQFRDRSVYVYTYGSAGATNVEQMKSLARLGHGLNAFINTTAKYRYAGRQR